MGTHIKLPVLCLARVGIRQSPQPVNKCRLHALYYELPQWQSGKRPAPGAKQGFSGSIGFLNAAVQVRD